MAVGVNYNGTNATGVPALTPLNHSTVRMPLRAVHDSSDNSNETKYQGEQLQYDPTSMGFTIGIIALIGIFFAWLILTDCSRKYMYRAEKHLRRHKTKSGSSSNEKGTASAAPATPFDAAAQMEGGHASASASEGDTTLQADPSHESVGAAGPSSSSNAVGAASPATPRNPPRLPSL